MATWKLTVGAMKGGYCAATVTWRGGVFAMKVTGVDRADAVNEVVTRVRAMRRRGFFRDVAATLHTGCSGVIFG